MTCEPEYQQPKFATKRKDEKTFEVDGQEIKVSLTGNWLELGGFYRITFDGEINEQRVHDMMSAYEQGKKDGIRLGETWTKQEIKNWLGVHD